jgi:hypothetical protein
MMKVTGMQNDTSNTTVPPRSVAAIHQNACLTLVGFVSVGSDKEKIKIFLLFLLLSE